MSDSNLPPQAGDYWGVFRLPRSHWHCQLANFEWAAVNPASLEKHVRQFVHDVVNGSARHLVLTGQPGLGKSHIGVAVYRAVSAVVGTALTHWMSVPTFCEEVKSSYSTSDYSPWTEFEDARRLVVLDDLFGRTFTAHDRDQIVTRLIDIPYQNNAAMLITMNQPVEELGDRIPPHEISRLTADSTIIPVGSRSGAHDWRRNSPPRR